MTPETPNSTINKKNFAKKLSLEWYSRRAVLTG